MYMDTQPRMAAGVMPGSCWVEMRMESRAVLPPSTWSVTWVWPSGRSHPMPLARASHRRAASWRASSVSGGSMVSVAPVAWPTMTPWSPAPSASPTAASISADCARIPSMTRTPSAVAPYEGSV